MGGSLLVAILLGAAPPLGAQELTNHALDKPYMAEPLPAQSYADADGLELTNGERGPANYRAAQWSGWRDTSYTEPIRVTVDLGEPTWIDEVVITTCALNDDVRPPDRVDVWISGGDFPHDVPVQIAQATLDEPYEPGEAQVLQFEAAGLGCMATQVRLDFQQRTWTHLFVDEIEILGGPAADPRLLPVLDVTLEAETLGGGVDIDGALGQTVLIDAADETLAFEVPLPAGDYTIRVRSLAKEPDTYSELVPRLGDLAMRAHPVTNNVFTWQRSHFTQAADGNASIELALGEGAGFYVDQIRVHPLTLNEPIATLREFGLETTLAAGGGEAKCVIAVDDAGAFAALGETLAQTIADRSGARPEVLHGADVSGEMIGRTNIIALGERTSNFAILRASPNSWKHIATPPEDGGPQIHIEVDPRGTGANVVVAGGVDEAQVTRSIALLTGAFTGDETLALPWMAVPQPKLATDPAKLRELAVESGKWLRQGAIRTLMNQWKAHGDDAYRMLAYRYIEYKDSADTIRPISRDGFIEAELYKLITRFDEVEHRGSLTELERLQLTNTLLAMADQCGGIFDWELCGRKYHPTDEVTRIVSEADPRIANNHQTFPIYSLLTQGQYFSKYYELSRAEMWLRWADWAMQGQLMTSKPQCDCWGYQDITMIHTARYAAATGRWDYFDAEPLQQYLRLRFASHDNMGSGVGYGDVGGYRPGAGTDFRDENAALWTTASGGQLDLDRVNPDELLGIYTHPLEPLWYELNGTDAAVPQEQCFDKITFRDAVDSDRAYLLLDGLSRGYHGHWDGNSILRFTDNGRLWLCEGDYLKGDPKDHNTITLMRDGESGRPGLFSALATSYSGNDWGVTETVTPAYAGIDWTRHILWHRSADTFILFDEAMANEAGTYDVKARFRSLGETTLADRTWRVAQAGGQSFYLHAPGEGKLVESSDPEDAKNWQSYDHADPTPRLLRHQMAREMAPGDSLVLPTVFYAGDSDGPALQTRSVSENAIVTKGSLNAITGVGGLSVGDVEVDAGQYVLGPDTVLAVGLKTLTIGRVSISTSDALVDLEIDPASGRGTLVARDATTLVASDGWRIGAAAVGGSTQPTTLAAGTHEIRAPMRQLRTALTDAHARIWRDSAPASEVEETRPDYGIEEIIARTLPDNITTLATGDITGDGGSEIVAGCDDGTVVALTVAGQELWRHEFSARVNDLALGDLDDDGKSEIACAIEDENLHVLGPDGAEIWTRSFEAYRAQGGIEGHPRVVLVADFEGDGEPEVAVGCANSIFYVLDATGQTKTSDGEPWEVITQHKASAIDAVDVTGDGQRELLCGFTYFGRKIVDFAKTGRARVSNLSGCVSGCGTIASADVDGDVVPEAVFADKDGQVTACRQPAEGNAVEVLWQKMIGDDAVSKVVTGDVDDDGADEIVLGSNSGFLALLTREGTVQWLRYAENQVTDVALLEMARIARSSIDGTVAIYDVDGEEIGLRQLGGPVQMLTANGELIAAAAGEELVLLRMADQ